MRLAAALLCVAWPLAAQAPARSGALGGLNREFESVVRRTQPAVVQIVVTAWGAGGDERGVVLGEERRTGSGVIVTPDGYLITNAHVVDGARRVQVVMAQAHAGDVPGRSAVRPEGRRMAATIVGIDRETDLAVLRVAGTGLPHLSFADSDSLVPGQIVLVFGSPLGLAQSVSLGVVSAVGRQLEADAPVVYIQTDAAVNPGNSGGAMVDVDGGLVGISTMILSRSGGSEGLGFAVPSAIARAVFEQIRGFGRVRRGVIGVRAQTITAALSEGLRLEQDWGVILGDVVPRSPAAAAGLRSGDIVTSLNGKIMENARQFDVNLYRLLPGTTATLEVKRGAQRLTVPVRVAARDDDPGRFEDLVNRGEHLVPALGMLAIPVSAEIGRQLPWLRRQGGVLLAAFDASSMVGNSGLYPGDVVYLLNGAAVTTLADLNRGLAQAPAGSPLVVHIDRRGDMRYVVLELTP